MTQTTKNTLTFILMMALIIGGAVCSCLSVSNEMTKAEQNYTNNN